MKPRFIVKTHTEALRPGNYSILISKCTFPDKGAYPEQVEKRLQEFIRNKSVAKFTVMTATTKNRGFDFLHDNMIWGWKGYLINCALKYLNKNNRNDINDFYKLTNLEKIMYSRFFIETEGSLILKLAKRLVEIGTISYSYLKSEIQNIFGEIFDEYIDLAPDFRTRSKIVEAQKQLQDRNKRYDPGTIAHKVKPHIQAFVDLGLLTIENADDDEIYKSHDYGNVLSFDVFYRIIGNFRKLEEIIQDDEYFQLIAQIYNLNPIAYYYPTHAQLLKQSLGFGYNEMRDKVTGMADIDAVINWGRIHLLSELNILTSRKDFENYFGEMRKKDPSSIRYHLDGKGNIAYLIINNWL